MRYINFTKMSAAGNDFVVMDNRRKVLGRDLKKIAENLCDRKRSIGADGVLIFENSKRADVRMKIFNPDGSEAAMCGNGVRCLAKFAVDHGLNGSKFSIETLAGVISAEVKGNVVKAKMVEPKNLKLGINLNVNGKKGKWHFIDTGVPHAVKILNSLERYDVEGMGRAVRFHRHFSPKGVNADFAAIHPGNRLEVKTYERGVEDETLACGTGSTAAALVAAALKNLKSPVSVHTAGGETLKVYFSRKGLKFYEVYLEGRVQKNFEGRVML